MSLLYLKSTHFNVQDEKLLYQNSELTLILFYSNDCRYSKNALAALSNLASKLKGCRYAIINVKANADLVDASRNTDMEIKYVPQIFLYYNHAPVKQFNTKRSYEMNDLKAFIEGAANELNNTFRSTGGQSLPPEKTPEYTTGTPKCDDDGVCYLDFDKAYGSL